MTNDNGFTATGIRNYINTHDTVRVVFTKKNGDERIMICTLNPFQIPWEHQPKGESERAAPENQIRVFDLEAQGWRSFLVESVTSIE